MEERVPEAQDFVAQTDEYSLQQDDVFRAFKKQDIEATLAAASTGKFSDYWTVERLVDLNNIVDADSRASSDIKSIFTGSKNPRLRANKLGALVLTHSLELKDQGFPGGGSDTGGHQFSAPEPVFSAPAPTSQSLNSTSRSVSGNGAPPTASAIPFGQLQRFAFAPDLPPDCQLRVRKGPDADSETIAVVTRDEEIFAVAELGDWIRVELPGTGLNGELWMMSRMEGRVLLVPAEAPAPVAPAPAAPHFGAPAASDPAPDFSHVVHQEPAGMVSAPRMSQSVSAALNTSQRPASRGGLDPLSASLMAVRQSTGNNPVLHPSADGSAQALVSYTDYQRLERRVESLENALVDLISKLRSV